MILAKDSVKRDVYLVSRVDVPSAIFPFHHPLCCLFLHADRKQLPSPTKQAPSSTTTTAADQNGVSDGVQQQQHLPPGAKSPSAGSAADAGERQEESRAEIGAGGGTGGAEISPATATGDLGQEVMHLRRVNEALVERVEYFERGQLKSPVRRLALGTGGGGGTHVLHAYNLFRLLSKGRSGEVVMLLLLSLMSSFAGRRPPNLSEADRCCCLLPGETPPSPGRFVNTCLRYCTRNRALSSPAFSSFIEGR